MGHTLKYYFLCWLSMPSKHILPANWPLAKIVNLSNLFKIVKKKKKEMANIEKPHKDLAKNDSLPKILYKWCERSEKCL